MQLAVFNSTNEGGLAPGWRKEVVLVLCGGATLDLTKRLPGPDATLTAIGAFGGAKIVVPAGTRLAVDGLSLFGGRSVAVRPGDGPSLRIHAFWLFGGVRIVEGAPVPAATAPPARANFPY